MVENATDIGTSANAEPFNQSDRRLAQILASKMQGLTGVEYHTMKARYMTQGRMVKGRQMLWLLFQNYQVDKASIALYKSKQLRELKLGNNLPSFLNQWQELLSDMEEKPSPSELHLLFVEQVRRHKPMAETWNWLGQGILKIEYPPTYETYLGLC